MIAGIFVGGKSSRMGGAPKGLLSAPDTGEALVVRTARLLEELSLQPVLVGRAEAYQGVLPEVARLADDPQGVGPLGGLGALLRAAGSQPALAVACDMPKLSPSLLAALRDARGTVVAPRGEGGFWEPFFARYESARVLPTLEGALAAGVRSFQGLFGRLSVTELSLTPDERALLCDWDTPQDLPR